MSEPDIRSASAAQFDDIVLPYLARMGLLAERLIGSDRRDDIVQEALLRAWTKRDQFDATRGTLSSWLLAITADRARRAWRRTRRPILLSPPRGEALEDRLDVAAAISKLSPRQRLAVDCFYFVGLSVDETAQVMGCSEGTVKSTLSDARARLKGLLEGDR